VKTVIQTAAAVPDNQATKPSRDVLSFINKEVIVGHDRGRHVETPAGRVGAGP
jgi:hypothetical protein